MRASVDPRPAIKDVQVRRRQTSAYLVYEWSLIQSELPNCVLDVPTWAMILDAYVVYLSGKRMSLTGLWAASGLPRTNARRRTEQLVQQGILRVDPDCDDKRRSIVSLTQSAIEIMDRIVDRLSFKFDVDGATGGGH